MENNKDSNSSLPGEDENLDESDPYIFEVGSTVDNVVSVDSAISPKDQTVSTSPHKSKKLSSKKRLKKLTAKKASSSSNAANGDDESSPQEILSIVTDIDSEKQASRRKSTSAVKMSNATADNISSLENEHGDPSNSSNTYYSSYYVLQFKKEQQKRNPKKSSSKEQAEENGESHSKSKGLKRGSSSNKEMEEEIKEEAVALKPSEAELPKESGSEIKEDSKGTNDKTKTSKKKSFQDEMEQAPETKQGKKKRSVAAEEESDKVFQEETLDENAKAKATEKKRDSPVHKKPEKKLTKKLFCNKKSKAVSEVSVVKTSEETSTEQLELESVPGKTKLKSNGSVSTNEKSSKRESPNLEEKDEPLGDMSFLINVNSRISVFVADTSQEECELEPMTARERNDVYKVTQLYKLRARIGTKSENNLTTVRLSKQADTKMPKPGRVDRLLSELSIAASKEAFKDSPKNQAKRKHAATVDGDEQAVAGDGDHEQDGPPKKKLSKLSRTNKVRVF